jgi:hypothetical protein
MLLLVIVQTVAFDCGFGGRISAMENTWQASSSRSTSNAKLAPANTLTATVFYLVVASATSKNWSYRYWKDGKQRWLGLGSVKEVSLKEARLARDAARLRVKGDRSTPGVDIVQERSARRVRKRRP